MTNYLTCDDTPQGHDRHNEHPRTNSFPPIFTTSTISNPLQSTNQQNRSNNNTRLTTSSKEINNIKATTRGLPNSGPGERRSHSIQNKAQETHKKQINATVTLLIFMLSLQRELKTLLFPYLIRRHFPGCERPSFPTVDSTDDAPDGGWSFWCWWTQQYRVWKLFIFKNWILLNFSGCES